MHTITVLLQTDGIHNYCEYFHMNPEVTWILDNIIQLCQQHKFLVHSFFVAERQRVVYRGVSGTGLAVRYDVLACSSAP